MTGCDDASKMCETVQVDLCRLPRALVVAGCATYHPEPISPGENAVALENRTLENPRLKKFVELSLAGEVQPGSTGSWVWPG